MQPVSQDRHPTPRRFIGPAARARELSILVASCQLVGIPTACEAAKAPEPPTLEPETEGQLPPAPWCGIEDARHFGVVLSGDGGQTIEQVPESELRAAVRGSGAETVRVFNLSWDAVQPTREAPWNTELADKSILPFATDDRSVVVTLFSNARWMTDLEPPSTGPLPSAAPTSEADWVAYESYVRWIVGTYADEVDSWQVENEVYAFSGFWFAGDEHDYVDVVTTAERVVAELDPTAEVVLAGIQNSLARGLSGADGTSVRDDLAPLADRLSVVLADAPYSAAALHLYRDLEDIPLMVDWLRTELDAAGRSGTPILSTEGAGPGGPGDWVTNEPTALASDLVKRYALSFASGVCQLQLFSLASDPWGLIDPATEAPRTSYHTLAQMVEFLGGFHAAEALPSPVGVHVVRFDVGETPWIVAWSDTGASTIDLSGVFPRGDVEAAEAITQLDPTGTPIVPPFELRDKRSVEVGEIPVYVRTSP